MTKRQRAQVVELLRCAADSDTDVNGEPRGMAIALWTDGHWFGQSYMRLHKVMHDAWYAAAKDLGIEWPNRNHEVYRLELLEAAQRVEDEEWP